MSKRWNDFDTPFPELRCASKKEVEDFFASYGAMIPLGNEAAYNNILVKPSGGGAWITVPAYLRSKGLDLSVVATKLPTYFKYFGHVKDEDRIWPGADGVLSKVKLFYTINGEPLHTRWRSREAFTELYAVVDSIIDPLRTALSDGRFGPNHREQYISRLRFKAPARAAYQL